MRSLLVALALLWGTASAEEAPVPEESSPAAEADTAQGKTAFASLLEDLYPIHPDEYVAQGHFFLGTKVSLIQAGAEDLDIMIGDVYELDGYMLTAEAFGAYFVRDAMALGLRAGYTRTEYTLDFKMLEDLTDLKQKRDYLSQGFFVAPFLRNYLKIFNTRSLYFFNETRLTYEYSNGLSAVDDYEELNKTTTSTHSVDCGLYPGVAIFLIKGFSFETSVGLLGLSSTVMTIEENDTGKESKLLFNTINFKINLLALNFSLGYYF